jgi:hypothetical protein
MWLDTGSTSSPQFFPSQSLHFCAWEIRRPFARHDNFWSAKRSRGLLEQFGLGVEFDLIKNEDFSGDEPDCEANHQRAERESCCRDRVLHFHG